TVAATSTAAAITATAATWTGLFRLRSVHPQGTTVVVVVIEGFDCRIQLGLVAEGHKGKTFGLSGFTVGDDFHPFNRAVGREKARNIFFSRSVGQVAHVNIHLIRF